MAIRSIDTPWAGKDAGKLYLQSGQFESTMKTSLDVSGVDAVIHGISWDGTNTPWCGSDDDKLYLQSGQFSATIKTSLAIGGVDTTPTEVSWDGTNTPWCGDQADKLYLQSGQFSATIKNSLEVNGIDSKIRGVSYDSINTPWSGVDVGKLYLQSGQFSSTLKTSFDTSGIDIGPQGISWDGINTLWCGNEANKLYLQSGQFSSTLKTSLDVSGIDISVRGIETNDINSRLGIHTPIISSLISVSTVSGSLNSQPGCAGFSTSTSGVLGILNIATELGSSAVEISGASGFLGSFGILTLMTAPTIGTSTASGSLSAAMKLRGSLISTSTVSGWLGFLTFIEGSAVGTSNCFGALVFDVSFIGSAAESSEIIGDLFVVTSLGSSTVEISGVSGSLSSFEVATKLRGSAVGASDVSGWLGFLIFVAGSATEVSEITGCIDLELLLLTGIGLETSSVTGYLSVIPDFNAATLFWRPQNNILETLEWKTSVLKAHDGTEQRIKIRQSPRQYFRLRLLLETDKMNTWFDSVLHTWQKQQWLLPIWTEAVKHTADIDFHDTVIEVDTTSADFRNNNKAIVWKSETEYEAIVIDTKTDSQLNLSYSMLNSFTGNKYIIPVRTAYMISSSRKEKQNSPVSFVDLIFAVYDNINLSNEISIPAYRYREDYDYLTLLATPAFMDLVHAEDSDGDIIISDFGTGIFRVESNSNFNFLSQNHIFFNDTKVNCWEFRQFLHSLNGRQKTVLIPTFRDDVIQTDDIEILDTSVRIENVKLAENMGFNVLRKYIGFYFSTGNLIIREIIGITEIDYLTEQISFDSALGYGSLIESGDCKICFIDKCRLASDKVELFWLNAHKNECQTNFMRVK